MTYGSGDNLRLPPATQEGQPWRIHAIVPDFRLEDVWALPVEGGADEFGELLQLLAALRPEETSAAAGLLWRLRDRLGAWFGIGRISAGPGEGAPARLAIPGTEETSLTARLPADLRGTAAGLRFRRVPFTPLYRTDREAAAEISNRTMHGVAHFGWVERGDGRYRGQMAVYVKPRGPLGQGYMALIKPFRYLVVYPALMRQLERAWESRPQPGAAPVRAGGAA